MKYIFSLALIISFSIFAKTDEECKSIEFSDVLAPVIISSGQKYVSYGGCLMQAFGVIVCNTENKVMSCAADWRGISTYDSDQTDDGECVSDCDSEEDDDVIYTPETAFQEDVITNFHNLVEINREIEVNTGSAVNNLMGIEKALQELTMKYEPFQLNSDYLDAVDVSFRKEVLKKQDGIISKLSEIAEANGGAFKINEKEIEEDTNTSLDTINNVYDDKISSYYKYIPSSFISFTLPSKFYGQAVDGGRCIPVNLSFSIFTASEEIKSNSTSSDALCSHYDKYLRKYIELFLYLMTAIYVYRVWHRALIQ